MVRRGKSKDGKCHYEEVVTTGKKLRIVIACGSGIATSTVAALKVGEVCKEMGIDAIIDHTTIGQLKGVAENYDLACTTANYSSPLTTRFLNVVSFITGINEAKKKEELKEILNELNQ